MSSTKNRIDLKLLDNLPKELSNLHKFLDMIEEIASTDNKMSKYLNPLILDYWTIYENAVVYEYLKKDKHLGKRCFVYLKQVKYLLRDVDKFRSRSENYKKKYKQLKEEYDKTKYHFISTKKKLQFLEEEREKTFVPKIVFDKEFETNFELDIIENHYNEFKSKKICNKYENANTYSLHKKSLEKIYKSIIGFLNADGGTLYIGVEDDGITNGIKFINREHLDQFMKQIDNYLLNLYPIIFEKFYDYKFWKIGENSIVVLIIVYPQKCMPKKRYSIKSSDITYIRCHSITRSIKLND